MIIDALKFLAEEINKYLAQKIGVSTDTRISLGNVAFLTDSKDPNKALMSLINVEEDRVSRQHENFTKTVTGVTYKAPPLLLNIYILFSFNLSEYTESVKWLSYVMQFFQFQSSFNPITHPELEKYKIEKLIVELYSMNFEQINHLWSVSGGKYMPSVMYKVKQLIIDEDAAFSESGFVKDIRFSDKVKPPVS
jgi:hypothetical protein